MTRVRMITYFISMSVIVTALLTGCSMRGQSGRLEKQYAVYENTSADIINDRFSIHDTNLGKIYIMVDHETNVQYLYNGIYGTMCPLFNADGTPMLIDLNNVE